MKKLKLMLCIILVLLATSCKKEQNKANTPQQHTKSKVNWVIYNNETFRNNIKPNYIILYLTSPQCPPCNRLEKTTFSSNRVVPVMNGLFFNVKLNISDRKYIKLIPKILKEDNSIPRLIYYIRKVHDKKHNQIIDLVPDRDIYGVDKNEFVRVLQTTGVIKKFQLLKLLQEIQSLRSIASQMAKPKIKTNKINFDGAQDSTDYILNL